MRVMRNVFCILCLIVFTGCGSVSQNRLGTPFGSDAEEAAFKKAVAADSFPRADQVGIRSVSRR